MVKATLKPKSLQQFLDAVGQFAAGMKITMRDAMLEQAALACQDAAIFTPPMPASGGKGLTPQAHKIGLGAVAGDIRKIFVAANDRKKSATGLITNQIAMAAKHNDFAMFQKLVGGGKLLDLPGLNYMVHKFALDPKPERAFQKARNFFNRAAIKKNEYGTQNFVTDLRNIHNKVKGQFGGRIKQGKRIGVVKQLVEDKNELNNYIMQRQQMVGSVKSGWAAALRSLPLPTDLNGQDGPPGAQLRSTAWVFGKSGVVGYNVSSFSAKFVQIALHNSIGNINGIADEAGTLGMVFANRVKQMPAQVKYRTQKPVDKFNRK